MTCLTDDRFPDRLAQSIRRGYVFDASTPKFTAQAIRRANEIDWKPFISFFRRRAGEFRAEPAGLSASKGVVTAMFIKTPDDPKCGMIRTSGCIGNGPSAGCLKPTTTTIRWLSVIRSQMAVELLSVRQRSYTRQLDQAGHKYRRYQLPLFIPGILSRRRQTIARRGWQSKWPRSPAIVGS